MGVTRWKWQDGGDKVVVARWGWQDGGDKEGVTRWWPRIEGWGPDYPPVGVPLALRGVPLALTEVVCVTALQGGCGLSVQ